MPGFRERLVAAACAFIPVRVTNKTVVGVMELLRRFQRRRKKDYSFHLLKNEEAFLDHREQLRDAGGYIEDQRNYTDLWFGSCTVMFSGCEIIAAYNALTAMKERHFMTLPRMIAEFEKDGMMLSGKFGTAPGAIRDFFDRHGFRTEFSTREDQFDRIAEMADSLILTLYNDKRDIRKEVHTVNLSKENGAYMVHNFYGNGHAEGPYASIGDMLANINRGKAKGISLVGIARPS